MEGKRVKVTLTLDEHTARQLDRLCGVGMRLSRTQQVRHIVGKVLGRVQSLGPWYYDLEFGFGRGKNFDSLLSSLNRQREVDNN